MISNIDIFRQEFLNANTWAQRKNGVPLNLLDKLSVEELDIAENELILSANTRDTWPIIGLGYIRSAKALPALYSLLQNSKNGVKIIIAHSIFEICKDVKMIDVVLQELPRTTNQYELIDVLYMLPTFQDKKITASLNDYRNHKEYLIAYNATSALGLSTNEVVNKFRQMDKR